MAMGGYTLFSFLWEVCPAYGVLSARIFSGFFMRMSCRVQRRRIAGAVVRPHWNESCNGFPEWVLHTPNLILPSGLPCKIVHDALLRLCCKAIGHLSELKKDIRKIQTPGRSWPGFYIRVSNDLFIRLFRNICIIHVQHPCIVLLSLFLVYLAFGAFEPFLTEILQSWILFIH